MQRHSFVPAVLLGTALLLGGLTLAGCGESSDSSTPKPTPPAPAPERPEEPTRTEPEQPAQPVAPDSPAVKAPEPPAPPAQPPVAKEPESAPSPAKRTPQKREKSSAVQAVEMVASQLGIEVTDANRELLQKIADAAGDEDNRDKVRELAAKMGLEQELGLEGLTDKLGLGGDEDDEVGRAANKARKGVDDALGGLTKRGEDEAGAGKRAVEVDPELAGKKPAKLRKLRKAEIAALQTELTAELTALREKFDAKAKAKPAKAATFAERHAKQEAQLRADYEAKMQDVRARYKAAIEAAQ